MSTRAHAPEGDVVVRAAPDDALWDGAVAPGYEPEPVRRRSRPGRAEHAQLCRLVAVRGDVPLGRLHGVFLNPELFLVCELVAREPADLGDAARELVARLAPPFGADGIEVLVWDGAASDPLRDALDNAGFYVARAKRFVERTVTDYSPPPRTPLSLKSLAEVGEDVFLAALAASSEGDPFDDLAQRDPRAEYDVLVALTDGKFEPTDWYVAFLGEDAVGVVLPQVYPRSPEEGTLYYVGVKPAFRGRGYGRRLHALGLGLLASRGVTRYLGSTDTRNDAMIAVFEANGCEHTRTQSFYAAESCS